MPSLGAGTHLGGSLLVLPRSLESERYTPHYTVPIFPLCPQENVLPTLPVFQGAAISRERFSHSLLRNVAVLGGFLPLWRSLEQLDRPSPADPLLQGTKLAALSIPKASLERPAPLTGHLALWEPLPSVSRWVLPSRLWFLQSSLPGR